MVVEEEGPRLTSPLSLVGRGVHLHEAGLLAWRGPWRIQPTIKIMEVLAGLRQVRRLGAVVLEGTQTMRGPLVLPAPMRMVVQGGAVEVLVA